MPVIGRDGAWQYFSSGKDSNLIEIYVYYFF